MLKIHFDRILAQIKNFFLSLKAPQLKSVIFLSLYIFISVIFLFLASSPLKGIIIIFVAILLWKIMVGLSWLNFCYLLLGYVEMAMLSFWFKQAWLALIFVALIILFFKKIITSDKKSSQFLSYFISTGWILLSYGLYFYLNQPFFVSLIIYLGGLLPISFLNFLILEKERSINYLIYLLINLEAYCLLILLSLNGLQFGSLILLLEYLILHFV
jgi:hypothetical protein